MISACLDSGPGDVGYMAPTLGQAKRLLWRPLMQDLRDPAARAFITGKPNHSELFVEFRTGVRLYLYSAEAYERVRGDGFKLFVTDETDDPLFSDEVFDEAIHPALSDNLGELYQLGTPKGRGRLYREYRKGQPSSPAEVRDPDYDSIQVTSLEAGIIPRSEIERARRTRPSRAFAQEYLATFNAPVGLVYDAWNEARHVVNASKVPALDELDEVIVGVDWGTAKRGSMVVLGLDRVWIPPSEDYDGCELPRVWLLEEHSEAGLAYADRSGDRPGWWSIGRDIQRRWRPTRWYCDPAGGSEEETEAEAAGYLLQLQRALHQVDNRVQVLPGDNRVSLGISAVQGFLHYDDVLLEPPRLFVLDTCTTTIGEFNGYRWTSNRNLEGEYEERPVKQNDHCVAAGAMVATASGDVPIEDVQAGMLALTRDGYRPIAAAWMASFSAPTLLLTTSDGRTLEATAEHRIWSEERGWIRLDELRPGDLLRVCGETCARTPIGSCTAVESVTPTGRSVPVYDLTVDGAHEFFANRILVHNCLDACRYAIFSHFYQRRRRRGRNEASFEGRGG